MARRLFRKAVQQGRSEEDPEEVPTALREGRSPISLILANGKTPPVLPISGKLFLSVEDLNDAKTPLADFVNSRLADPRKLLAGQ